MSGGVDSSVAASLLLDGGYEVAGITMLLRHGHTAALEEAQHAARALGIHHVAVDLSAAFDRLVLDYFCREYERGRTPNPCIRCNQLIKFGLLFEKARSLGGDFFATGHYVRTGRDERSGRCLLLPGRDSRKDQSYFLYTLNQEQLQNTLTPLGGLTKEQVKRIARQRGLPSAGKKESQDICFLAGTTYARFLQERAPGCATPGPIMDMQGRVIGEHRGLVHYTIGQRRGIGIAAREPLYVISLDAQRNAVMVGEKKCLARKALTAGEVNCISEDKLLEPVRVMAKIRYLHTPAEAVVAPLDDSSAAVTFTDPQAAVTPGQSIVFYDPELTRVLGGGVIMEAGPGRHEMVPGACVR